MIYVIFSGGTIPGTAGIGADFTTVNEHLMFAPGNAGPKLVRIPIVDNNRTEADEEFSVVLSTADPDVNIVNSPATVRIVDDDGRQFNVISIYCVEIFYNGNNHPGLFNKEILIDS